MLLGIGSDAHIVHNAKQIFDAHGLRSRSLNYLYAMPKGPYTSDLIQYYLIRITFKLRNMVKKILNVVDTIINMKNSQTYIEFVGISSIILQISG